MSTSAELRVALERALRAGVRVIVIRTPEELRALDLLEQVGERLDWTLRTWSAASGVDGSGQPRPVLGVLRDATAHDELWVLLEPAEALTDPATARVLRDAAQRSRGPAIVVVEPAGGPAWRVPPEAWVTTLSPPSAASLQERVVRIGEVLERDGHEGAAAGFEIEAPAISRAALGLSLVHAERLIAEAIVQRGASGSAAGIAAFVAEHKASLVHTDGLLESVTPASDDDLGGHDTFKDWVRRRALALEPSAALAGIPSPRGALLLGVQGCGKSLAARWTATALGLPLLRLDPGRLFGGTVGKSEANLRVVLAALEAAAPVVAWVDEIDKGLAGTGGGRSDGGTASRVVGGLLTWLAERKRPVFVVATANDVTGLPPELLRRGRLDEIFFFDLPDAPTREQVLRVHLLHRPARELDQPPPLADPAEAFAALARDAEGFSGAELEAALTEARLSAFANGRPLAAADFRTALQDTVPLSVSRAEPIAALRDWATDRTRNA